MSTVDLICLITNGLYLKNRTMNCQTSVVEEVMGRVGLRLMIKGRLSRGAGSTAENDSGALGTARWRFVPA